MTRMNQAQDHVHIVLAFLKREKATARTVLARPFSTMFKGFLAKSSGQLFAALKESAQGLDGMPYSVDRCQLLFAVHMQLLDGRGLPPNFLASRIVFSYQYHRRSGQDCAFSRCTEAANFVPAVIAIFS